MKWKLMEIINNVSFRYVTDDGKYMVQIIPIELSGVFVISVVDTKMRKNFNKLMYIGQNKERNLYYTKDEILRIMKGKRTSKEIIIHTIDCIMKNFGIANGL